MRILHFAPVLMFLLGTAGAFVSRAGYAKVALAVLTGAFAAFSFALMRVQLAPPGTDGEGMLWVVTLMSYIFAVVCVWAGVKPSDAIF